MSDGTLTEPKPVSRYFSQRIAQPLPLTRTRNTRKKYIGANIRQAIERVFNGLGGWETMMEWAKDNPDAFYGQVVPKLLPHELAESGLGGNLTIIVQRKSVETPSSAPLQVVGQGQTIEVIDGQDASMRNYERQHD